MSLIDIIQNCSPLTKNRETIQKSFGIEKARSGVYADNPENRKLKRVGQKYGEGKKEIPAQDRVKRKEEQKPKKYDQKKVEQYAKKATDEQLKIAANSHDDPMVKQVAQKEIENRNIFSNMSDEQVKFYLKAPHEDMKDKARKELENRTGKNYFPLEFHGIVDLQYYFDKYDEDLKTLNGKEKKALEEYKDLKYFEINKYLRSDITGWDKKFIDKIENDMIKPIDDSFKKFELKDDLILQRGIKKNTEFFNNLNIGDVYQDNGFVSTTLGGEDVLRFFRKQESEGITINIIAKKGTNAIPMENIGIEDSDKYDAEFEFLLKRGSKFKVIKKEKNNNITVELL